MNCWTCGKTSQGVCIFCGRGVCKKDTKMHPYILAAFDEQGDVPKVIMVDDALWCGICKPIPEPVEMPELEGEVGGRPSN